MLFKSFSWSCPGIFIIIYFRYTIWLYSNGRFCSQCIIPFIIYSFNIACVTFWFRHFLISRWPDFMVWKNDSFNWHQLFEFLAVKTAKIWYKILVFKIKVYWIITFLCNANYSSNLWKFNVVRKSSLRTHLA